MLINHFSILIRFDKELCFSIIQCCSYNLFLEWLNVVVEVEFKEKVLKFSKKHLSIHGYIILMNLSWEYMMKLVNYTIILDSCRRPNNIIQDMLTHSTNLLIQLWEYYQVKDWQNQKKTIFKLDTNKLVYLCLFTWKCPLKIYKIYLYLFNQKKLMIQFDLILILVVNILLEMMCLKLSENC